MRLDVLKAYELLRALKVIARMDHDLSIRTQRLHRGDSTGCRVQQLPQELRELSHQVRRRCVEASDPLLN